MKKDNIAVEWNRLVAEVLGDDTGVSGLGLASTKDDEQGDHGQECLLRLAMIRRLVPLPVQ